MAGPDQAGQGVWLHAVIPDAAEARTAGLAGIGDVTVHIVRSAGLRAVVSTVGMDEYGAEPLRRHLEDLVWLERVAREHHRVIAALAEADPVVPAGLATVYRGDARVAAMLSTQRQALLMALERVTGHVEWGVKAFAAGPPDSADSAEPGGAAGAGGPGAAYLRRRRAQLSAHELRREQSSASAEQAHARLSRHAGAARRHPPQDRRLSGEVEAMVLNGAYLVHRDRVGTFVREVEAIAVADRAIRLQLTGPWPPYSFAGPVIGPGAQAGAATEPEAGPGAPG